MTTNKEFTNLLRTSIHNTIMSAGENLKDYGLVKIEGFIIGGLFIIDLASTLPQQLMGQDNNNMAVFRNNIIDDWNAKYANQITEQNIFINVEKINPFKLD